ncbi:MAG: hypothetical protein CMM48_14235 [Rhodospirillaceae bacterium]|nr:hypothetical protein [Rhodospirillaceae bacterium]MBL25046.1 hypothetical protein [Rhodospirillaceae bacterium]HAA93182.1 hypothetical protein [Rhodospirillaceae bacterium]
MADQSSDARLIELAEDPYAIYEHFVDQGWTDGLPVIPPTEERIADMLRFSDRAPDDVIVELPPKGGPATVQHVAINAAMAGCKPEYLPVIIAALQATVEPEYNLYGRQTTTHPGAHLVIVHGPARTELDINCRQNVFGQGWRANATIGRALRLLLMNVGGGLPGITDMATHGHPGKYSYCIGEDEENSPWPGLHADRGFEADSSAVTVLCAESPHNINDMVSKTPELYLGSAASAMSHLGANGPYRGRLDAEQMLVMTAESAQWLDERGWDKQTVKEFIFENARCRVGDLRDRGGWGQSKMADFIDENDDDALAPIVPAPDHIVIVVAGGHGRHMQAVLASSYCKSVTKPIT